MASVYRPSYTRIDPGTGRRTRKRLRKWYVEYRDAGGNRTRVAGYRDKEATKQLAARLEKQAALEAEGIVDRHASHKMRPIPEHVEDYRRYLNSRDNTDGHVKTTIRRISVCFEACECYKLDEIDANRIAEWLAGRRAAGLSAATSNHYLRAVKSFTRWLYRSIRIPRDPTLHLQGVNARVDVRRRRRALSTEELRRLIETTRTAAELSDLAGPDRAMLYLVASSTGLRASELTSLTAASFDLERSPATLTVEAAYSKHRREDVVPVHPDIVDTLRRWLGGHHDPSERLWPGRWARRSAEMLRSDLKRTRVPYETSEGVADFHALRHAFLSNLARAGVHPKAIQCLARHSTAAFTLDRYAHLGLVDLVEGLRRLGVPQVTSANASRTSDELRRSAEST